MFEVLIVSSDTFVPDFVNIGQLLQTLTVWGESVHRERVTPSRREGRLKSLRLRWIKHTHATESASDMVEFA
jgi:hypothetical protein